MNKRERFIRTMTFDKPDRPAWGDYFYYETTRKRWESEGLPVGADLNEYFNMDFDPFTWKVNARLGPVPAYENIILKDTDEYQICREPNGETVKRLKNCPPPAMPQTIRNVLETREDWDEYKKRLAPDAPGRLCDDIALLAKQSKDRDYPLGMWIGGTYGVMRNWWGVENISMLFFDSPGLIEEMMEYLTAMSLTMLEKVVASGVELDWVMFWEDLAYKNGPLISPSLFGKYCVPFYQKLMDKVRAAGIPVAIVDSDGKIDEIIPMWLDVGVRVMHPLEVAAGMDVVKMRKRYGKNIAFFGGIDKRILATDHQTIKKEITPILEKCFEQGGFIAACDHAVPPDVSFDNYRCYRDIVVSISEEYSK